MKVGERYLITADNWFFAPDGENYRAVFGTVHAVVDAEQALGIRTNRNSTNWYVLIGDMMIAGCQIHYAMRADEVSLAAPSAEVDHEGRRHVSRCAVTRIYDADCSGLTPFGANSAEIFVKPSTARIVSADINCVDERDRWLQVTLTGQVEGMTEGEIEAAFEKCGAA